MRSRYMVLWLVVCLAVAACAALSQRGRGGAGMGMQAAGAGQPCGLGIGLGLGPAAIQQLNLTSNQVAQLQKIRDQFFSDTQPARAELQTRMKELAQLWTADKPSETAIRNKIAQMDTLRARIRNAVVDRTFAAMRVLTADQKAKLRTLVKTRPGFGTGMGASLGLGCDLSGAGCYMGGAGSGQGYRGGQSK